jgi:DNA-binding YbaB/EbfC family protein
MVNLNQIMKQAQAMQEKLAQIQESLSKKEIVGTAGGGLVEVTITGDKNLKKVRIDDSLLKAEEKEILEDLIVAACNDANKKAEEDSKNAMNGAMGNIPLPPGLKMPF